MPVVESVAWITQQLVVLLNPVAARLMRKEQPSEQQLERRMRRLGALMQESAGLLASVEGELKAREATLARVQEEMETTRRVAELHKAQAEAVRDLLRTEITREGRKALWQGVLVNLLFFALGIAVTALTATLK